MLNIFHLDMNFAALRTDYLPKLLERLAEMGYNAILWELENKVRFDQLGPAVDPEAMTKQEFRQLLNYARELRLEPIPLLQTIGHGEYVLLHPEFQHLRENPLRHDCYCTTLPAVRLHLKKLIAEYLELFGDLRFFHLGGDEAYEFGTCDACRAYIEQHGRNRLYSDYLSDLSSALHMRGIRPGVWADMVLAHPDEMDSVDRSLILWDWNYWGSGPEDREVRIWGEGPVTQDTLTDTHRRTFPGLLDRSGRFNAFYTTDFLKENGFEVILASSSRSAGDALFGGNFNRHARNIIGCARKAGESSLLGHCVTSWAIRQHTYETQLPLLAPAPRAAAEPQRTPESLLRETGEALFGTDPARFYEAAHLIGAAFPFDQTGDVGIQWNGLKDQLPAPAGFIADQLRRWREEGTLPERRQQLDEARAGLLRGIALLNDFAVAARHGLDILESWRCAAHLQLGQYLLAQRLLNEETSREYAMLAVNLRTQFQTELARFHRPESARRNAGQVYDAVIAFFSGDSTGQRSVQ